MLTLGRSWLLPALMVIMVMAFPMSSLMAQDEAGGEGKGAGVGTADAEVGKEDEENEEDVMDEHDEQA